MERFDQGRGRSSLGEKLQDLRKFRWLGKLFRHMDSDTGGASVSEERSDTNGSSLVSPPPDPDEGLGVPEGFEMCEPTYAFGAIGPLRLEQNPSGPSQDEIHDRPLLDEALAVEEPFAEKTPPDLYKANAQI